MRIDVPPVARVLGRTGQWLLVVSVSMGAVSHPLLPPRLVGNHGDRPDRMFLPRNTVRPSAHDTTSQLATITTDTGAFAPGDRDFGRYTTPGMCLATAALAQAAIDRTLTAQARRDSLNDSVALAGAAPVARACGARFTLATVQPHELVNLFNLALYEENDPLAQTILDTLAAQGDHDNIWLLGLNSYRAHRRFAAAAALEARIDALGASAQPLQVTMHQQILNSFSPAQLRSTADTARLQVESVRLLQLYATRPKTKKGSFEVLQAYGMLIWLAERQHPDSVPVLLAQVKAAMVGYPDSAMSDEQHKLVPLSELSLQEFQRKRFTPKWALYQRDFGRTMAPRLTADYWYPAPGRPASDTVRPVPGKINLICMGARPDVGYDFKGFGKGYGRTSLTGGTTPTAQLQRWLQQYGPRGLEVTLVEAAAGTMDVPSSVIDNYFRILGGYEMLFPSPAAEAQAVQWYVHEHEQLPVTVAVQVRHSLWLPASDGRRLATTKVQYNQFRWPQWKNEKFEASPQDSVYGPREDSPGTCSVIARDGTILTNTVSDDILRWAFSPASEMGGGTP